MNFKKYIPFMDEEDVDKLLDGIMDGTVTDVKFSTVAPFASDKKINEIFVRYYVERGKIINSLLPFVSSKALHQVVIERINGGGAEISESALPFMRGSDVKALFSFELAKERGDAEGKNFFNGDEKDYDDADEDDDDDDDDEDDEDDDDDDEDEDDEDEEDEDDDDDNVQIIHLNDLDGNTSIDIKGLKNLKELKKLKKLKKLGDFFDK